MNLAGFPVCGLGASVLTFIQPYFSHLTSNFASRKIFSFEYYVKSIFTMAYPFLDDTHFLPAQEMWSKGNSDHTQLGGVKEGLTRNTALELSLEGGEHLSRG